MIAFPPPQKVKLRMETGNLACYTAMPLYETSQLGCNQFSESVDATSYQGLKP